MNSLAQQIAPGMTTTKSLCSPSESPWVPKVLRNVLSSLECTRSYPMALCLFKQLFPQLQCTCYCCCSVTKSHLTFSTPWTVANQASLSFTISWNLLRLMSIESLMPSNHLILCHPLLLCLQSFPASGSFPMCWLFASCGQIIGASTSASVLPMNIQDRFPLRLIDLISVQSKGLSGIFSSTTV